ncbi:ABC transporter substrate-binding protein [Celeribacter ethanolicus]|uniref:Branched-chain amino acid ABC transporter substrate-binding protein n=1 Tax=Celeribacter ethanolicus TaxID=1758178 RepID=A0A291G9I8_9RHOB|nr:ABC transporter substrate-binding protein [Celeribacter ethanolicus]ATG46734.1 branched-chain amino acid ABC transporter substrate-binding protein [Celeribacter ethanolicus]TNE66258.1 MAG: branched-chain amino acid ABC transporter substrate-binding protein [Paracoccaceae bacterium]
MKKLLLATTAATLMTGAAFAEDVKVGILLGFTGPLETIMPHMADSAELAFKEISETGKFLGGSTISSVRGDSTCVDASAATAAAERLITADGVVAIMGADCSGVTGAVLSNVAVPNGVVMISPSATSPGLSSIEDNGLFFRTSPSDARQGEILADVLEEKGITSVAVTYNNSDYGKGLADAFAANYDGEITLSAPHEDGKADYSAEIAALASAGGELLVVLGYIDQGGKNIIQSSVDTGAFDMFLVGDGMYGESLLGLGDIVEGILGVVPWAEGEGTDMFTKLGTDAGILVDSTYTRESYDAGALIALAMAKGGAATREAVAANVLDVANAPGEKILPGEFDKALDILAAGGDIDYVGATNVELIGPGEAAGSYRYYTITDGAYETVDIR